MNGEYKVQFEDFDRSRIENTYTRIHYGKVKVDSLNFSFCVYETYLKEYNYLTFSMNFLDAVPGKKDEIGKYLIEKTKEKLKAKAK